jgi:hypothetical protein
MAKTLQWECDGEIPITMRMWWWNSNYNVEKYIQTHWNTLKCTICALNYIEIHHQYNEVHYNTLKCIEKTFKYFGVV